MEATLEKIQHVATQMHLEPAEESNGRIMLRVQQPAVAPCGVSLHQSKKHESLGVYDARVDGGRPVKLLKTMLTSACERNCGYCPFRAGRNYRRVSFKPEEMADTFADMLGARA